MWQIKRTPRFRNAEWCVLIALLIPFFCHTAGVAEEPVVDKSLFPPTLRQWKPHAKNPVFVGGGPGAWDERIRERGTILREGDIWHFWYTGYNLAQNDLRRLGYDTSRDGVHWKRVSPNPLLEDDGVEDMHVVKHDGKYIMVAEGRGDLAHSLISDDGIHWTD